MLTLSVMAVHDLCIVEPKTVAGPTQQGSLLPPRSADYWRTHSGRVVGAPP